MARGGGGRGAGMKHKHQRFWGAVPSQASDKRALKSADCYMEQATGQGRESVQREVGIYSHNLSSRNSVILAANVNDCVLHVSGASSINCESHLA